MSASTASLRRDQSRTATAAIVGIAITWGSMFFIVHDLVARMPVMDLLALRYVIATAVVVALAPKAALRLPKAARSRAIILGVLSALALSLQAFGLAHTTASSAGFITGLYVVLTPLFAAILLKEQIGRGTWMAVVLAAAGLAVLSPNGIHLGTGELLSLAGAAAFAFQVILMSRWATASEALGLTIIQCLTITVICVALAAPGGIFIPTRTDDWIAIVYTATVVGGLALLAQTWAQAHVPATRAAIIMGTEPVFAAAFAVALGGEMLTRHMLVGGGLLVLATVVVLRPTMSARAVSAFQRAAAQAVAPDTASPTICTVAGPAATNCQQSVPSRRRRIMPWR